MRALLLAAPRSTQTTMHVYETRCSACGGSGWARAPSNGRRGQLGTCMLCHGLGAARSKVLLLLLMMMMMVVVVVVVAAAAQSQPAHTRTCCRSAHPPAGYVRRTTARFCPDDPEHMTLVRPLSLDGKLKPRARQPQPQQQQQQQQQQPQQQQRQQKQQQQPQQHQHQHQQQVQYKPGSSAQSRVDSSDNTDNTRKLP
jgi:Mg-chelatase subunit ChlI